MVEHAWKAGCACEIPVLLWVLLEQQPQRLLMLTAGVTYHVQLIILRDSSDIMYWRIENRIPLMKL